MLILGLKGLKGSVTLIDGSEKRTGWLNLELQSPHVIERYINGSYIERGGP